MSHAFDGLASALAIGSPFAGFEVVLILFFLVTSIFWIWMLVEVLTSRLPSDEKLIWVLVIVFLHLLGALLYLFIGRKRGRVAA